MQKVALITAGSSGLGACVARTLVREAGMRVVINFSSKVERAESLAAEMRQMAEGKEKDAGVVQAVAIQADASKEKEIRNLVAEAHQVMGRIDVVISNAGWTEMRNFHDLDENVDENDWDECFSRNVKSHLWLFHAARPYLRQTQGCFIATASVAGVKPSGSSLAYATSKAALIHLVKSLAVIAAPEIRVNSVSPGVLLTEWGRRFSADQLETVRKSNKLGQFATVKDVAEQMRFLAQCQSMTGQNVVIDCGFSI